MSHIRELQDVIRKLHGVEAMHIESVQIEETFRGKTVWEGVVEVFSVKGHPRVSRVYAWSRDTDDPANPRRHVTVLHLRPIQSARDAVRAAILEEFRSLSQQL